MGSDLDQPIVHFLGHFKCYLSERTIGHFPNACMTSLPLCIGIHHLKFEWKKFIDRSFGGGECGIILCSTKNYFMLYVTFV